VGYRVALAANAGEALLRVEEEGMVPDLLITDLVMPGMGGEVLVTRLRKERPDLRVLLMSGYTDSAIGQQGGVDPDTPFIRKPFTVEEMVLKVEQVLHGPGA
jgi:CheY-like chemotaxis protein